MWNQFPLVLVAAVLVVPGPRAALFDGLPFDSISEFLIVVFILIAIVNRETRESLRTSLDRMRLSRKWFSVALVSFLVLKLLAGLLIPTTGRFEACFTHVRPPLEGAVDNTGCVRSFDVLPGYPIAYRNSSRMTTDLETIDFGPQTEESVGLSGSNWNIAHVNSSRYDRGYFPWEPEDLDIEAFPFRAQFSGPIDHPDSGIINVSYVGEGFIDTGSTRIELPPSYQDVSTVQVAFPKEDDSITVDFVFSNDRKNSEPKGDSYAQLEVRDSSGKLVTSGMSLLSLSIVRLLDAMMVALFVFLTWSIRRMVLTRHLLAPVLLTALLVVSERRVDSVSSLPVEPSVAALGVMAAVAAIGRVKRVAGLLVSGVLVSMHLVWNELESIAKHTVGTDYVITRTRGNDQLVYRGFVQEMLNSGFLRGGEDVYYFQPGIRYVLYVFHLILGSGDVLVGVAIAALSFAALVYFVSGLSSDGRIRSLALASGSFALVVWWSSSQTIQTMTQGLSEFGTWPLLFIVFGMIVRRSPNPRVDVAVGLLLGLLVWIRPNQGVAALAMLVIWLFVVRGSSTSIHQRTRAPLAFGALLLLIPIHNLYFGGVVKLLPGGHLNADQFGWGGILEISSNDLARQFYQEQLRGILYLPSVLPDIYSRKLGLAFALFGLVFLMGVFLEFRNRFANWRATGLLLLVVVGQAIPFLNYTVFRYFPVHIVAIQLSLVLVGMVLVAQSSDRTTRTLATTE